MTFAINQRVHVKETAFEFGGINGTIECPPDAIHELDADPWTGPFKYERRRHGVVLVYFVKFDEVADDGSGDGPYWGAVIAEEDLDAIAESG